MLLGGRASSVVTSVGSGSLLGRSNHLVHHHHQHQHLHHHFHHHSRHHGQPSTRSKAFRVARGCFWGFGGTFFLMLLSSLVMTTQRQSILIDPQRDVASFMLPSDMSLTAAKTRLHNQDPPADSNDQWTDSMNRSRITDESDTNNNNNNNNTDAETDKDENVDGDESVKEIPVFSSTPSTSSSPQEPPSSLETLLWIEALPEIEPPKSPSLQVECPCQLNMNTTNNTANNNTDLVQSSSVYLSIPLTEVQRELLMVVFTFPMVSEDPLKNHVQMNVFRSWQRLGSRTHGVVVGESDEWRHFAEHLNWDRYDVADRNSFDTPVITTTFAMMFDMYWARTHFVAYTNGDILLGRDVLPTLNAVLSAIKSHEISNRVLIVGCRTNLDWDLNKVVTENTTDEEFQSWKDAGTKMRPDAQDYFIVTQGTFDWHELPRFVVGRRAYDNWLTSKCQTEPNQGCACVDATETITAIHQTDQTGNISWGGGSRFRSYADREYNAILGNFQWSKPAVTDCSYFTEWVGPPDNRRVAVLKRPFHM